MKRPCRCKFAGFEPVRICGKHASELLNNLADETRLASEWQEIAWGLYDVVMCELNDKVCQCADHVAAYELKMKAEKK